MDKDKSESIGQIVIIGALVALVVAIIIVSIMWWRVREDRVRFEITQRQLFAFSCKLNVWAIAQERIPGPNLADAVSAIQQDKVLFEEGLRMCPLVVEGRDAWGTELIYSVDPTGTKAIITSAGPNRKYDGGQIDDINAEVFLP